MSIDMPVALNEVVEDAAAAETKAHAWIETALAVAFTVTAVLVVSFVAVMNGLV